MAITKEDVKKVISQLGDGDYTSYFFLPDFEKESGGIKLAYDHVKVMNENGFKATIIHKTSGFKPAWLSEYYEANEDGTFKNIPIVYLDDGNLPITMSDFFFIPEGFPNIMENLAKQNAPCKKVVFCQNWYYVLNALPPGVFWDAYGITDCLSITNSQTEYLKMIMPFLNIKNVCCKIDDTIFTPPKNKSDKKMQVSFIPSRDNGLKSYNVIKTFYALFPYFKFIQFREIKGLTKEDYAKLLQESAFYVHFDEYSSLGTAPLEAFLSECLVAGWDGVGGREYMNTDNMWIVPNGDILRLAMAIGNMIESYMTDDIPQKTYDEMKKATLLYTVESEKDSIIRVHNEYREERIKELDILCDKIDELNKNDELEKNDD